MEGGGVGLRALLRLCGARGPGLDMCAEACHPHHLPGGGGGQRFLASTVGIGGKLRPAVHSCIGMKVQSASGLLAQPQAPPTPRVPRSLFSLVPSGHDSPYLQPINHWRSEPSPWGSPNFVAASTSVFLEEGMATHSSILAWRIPRTEEPGGATHSPWESQRVGHN